MLEPLTLTMLVAGALSLFGVLGGSLIIINGLRVDNHKEEGACWKEFAKQFAQIAGIDTERAVASRNLRNLWFIVLDTPGAEEKVELLVFYLLAYGPNGDKEGKKNANHISMFHFEGSSSFTLKQAIDSGYGFHKWWINFTLVGVDDTLYNLMATSMPRSGAPMKPHKLQEASWAVWQAQQGNIQLYTSAHTESVLGQQHTSSMTAYTLPTSGPITDYFNNAAANTLNFYVAMTLNVIGIGTHNHVERIYFKAIGHPQVQVQGANVNIYYSMPVGMTAKALMVGISAQYMAICDRAAALNNVVGLHKVAVMMHSWGYLPNREVNVRGIPTQPNKDVRLSKFMWPGGFLFNDIHDDVLEAVRNDTTYIAGKMTSQKALNRGVGLQRSGARQPLAKIPQTDFQFFREGNAAPGVV